MWFLFGALEACVSIWKCLFSFGLPSDMTGSLLGFMTSAGPLGDNGYAKKSQQKYSTFFSVKKYIFTNGIYFSPFHTDRVCIEGS